MSDALLCRRVSVRVVVPTVVMCRNALTEWNVLLSLSAFRTVVFEQRTSALYGVT